MLDVQRPVVECIASQQIALRRKEGRVNYRHATTMNARDALAEECTQTLVRICFFVLQNDTSSSASFHVRLFHGAWSLQGQEQMQQGERNASRPFLVCVDYPLCPNHFLALFPLY